MGLVTWLSNIPAENWTQSGSAVAAVFVRIMLAPYKGLKQSVGGAAAGLLCAFVMTQPVVQMLGLQDNLFRDGVAAVLALIGEQIVRRIMDAADNETVWQMVFKGIKTKGGALISALTSSGKSGDDGPKNGNQS